MCVYLWEATEWSNVANNVIRLREKCVSLSVKLLQIECTLTDDVTRLVAVRNKTFCERKRFEEQFSCSSSSAAL